MTPDVFFFILLGVLVVALVLGGIYLARNDRAADPEDR